MRRIAGSVVLQLWLNASPRVRVFRAQPTSFAQADNVNRIHALVLNALRASRVSMVSAARTASVSSVAEASSASGASAWMIPVYTSNALVESDVLARVEMPSVFPHGRTNHPWVVK